jgi:RHS repeat-associated protein
MLIEKDSIRLLSKALAIILLILPEWGQAFQADQIQVFSRATGRKQYEVQDHLNNVRAVISDTKIPLDASDHTEGFKTVLFTSAHYDPFGMELPDRNYSSESYRFGFNGKEKDDEWKGSGNSYDFDARIYDARLGRWLSVDPLAGKFPDQSPYCFALNNPISFVDPDGREPVGPIDNQNKSLVSRTIGKMKNWFYGRRRPVAEDYGKTYVDEPGYSEEPQQVQVTEVPAFSESASQESAGNGDECSQSFFVPNPSLRGPGNFRFDFSTWIIGINAVDHTAEWLDVAAQRQTLYFSQGYVTGISQPLYWYNGPGSPFMAYINACMVSKNGTPLAPGAGFIAVASGFGNGIPFGTPEPFIAPIGQQMYSTILPCPPIPEILDSWPVPFSLRKDVTQPLLRTTTYAAVAATIYQLMKIGLSVAQPATGFGGPIVVPPGYFEEFQRGGMDPPGTGY